MNYIVRQLSTKYSHHLFLLCLIVSAGCVSRQSSVTATVPLSNAAVVLPGKASTALEEAAHELAAHLSAMSGAEIPIMQAPPNLPSSGFLFVMDPGMDAMVSLPERDVFGYFVADNHLVFHGAETATANKRAEQVLEAVHLFLHDECGIRWLLPVSEGALIPECNVLYLQEGRRLFPAEKISPILDVAAHPDELKDLQQYLPEQFRLSEDGIRNRYDSITEWARRHGFRLMEKVEQPEFISVPVDADLDSFMSLAAGAKDGVLDLRNMSPNINLPLILGDLLFERLNHLPETRQSFAVTFSAASYWLQGSANYASMKAGYSLKKGLKPDATNSSADFANLFKVAAPLIREYLAEWEQHNRLMITPALSQLHVQGYGDWRRGLFLHIDEYYSSADFAEKLKFLHDALTSEIDDETRQLLENIILAHEHARSTFLAASQLNIPGSSSDEFRTALDECRALMYLRQGFREELTACVPRLVWEERQMGDVTGMDLLGLFEQAEPYRQLPLIWRFQTDPDEIGVQEGWHKSTPSELAQWDFISLDRPWEYQRKEDTGLAGKLRDYNGVAWYALILEDLPGVEDGDLYLNVHGSSSSVELYVNGALIGQHSAASFPQTPASFRFPLPLNQNQEKDTEDVVVLRIDDENRSIGGIWRPVWLSLKHESVAESEEGSVDKDSVENSVEQ